MNENGEMGAKTHKLVQEAILFTPKKLTMLQHALKIPAFELDTQSVSFYRAGRNGQVPHHVGSTRTSGGACGEEYLLRMLAVRFPKR